MGCFVQLLAFLILADLGGSRSSCSTRKETRGKLKNLLRRRKKQLFGHQKKRKRGKRNKRGLFSPFVGWMFGQGDESSRKIKEQENTNVKEEQLKVNTLLEIVSKKVKNVPSDFFQVVTASGLEFSEFSRHQSSKAKKEVKEESNQQQTNLQRRNYKRRKSLFNSRPDPPWVGVVKSDKEGQTCPAYLLAGGGHALAESDCVMDMPPTLTVIFSVHRVGVTRVTLHPSLHLALLSLHPQVPGRVEALCHPEDMVGSVVGAGDALAVDSHQLGGWLEQAVDGRGGS